MPALDSAAGALTERLRLERQQQVKLSGGRRNPQWVAVAELWAGVVPLTGGERPVGEQQQATVRYRVRLRNRRDLSPDMRLVWLTGGGQVLNIRELFDPGPRAVYRQLVAEAGAAS